MAWDLTGLAWTAFVPPGVLAFAIIPLGVSLPRPVRIHQEMTRR
jgi:hypothetical protein